MLLIVRALLLWGLVALHIQGGALLFRRIFRQESPWLGFVVPSLLVVFLANWVEHLVPLTGLFLLLPLTTLACLGICLSSASCWDGLRLPTGIFLISFAFTYTVRCLHPDILSSSDGLADLNLVANFYQGETLPPTDKWLPPLKLEWYYTLQHYAASVLGRSLGVSVGIGYNLAHSVLLALTCLFASAVAWRLSNEKKWIACLMPFLILPGATGSSAYIYLTVKDASPWLQDNLSDGIHYLHNNPLWKFMGEQTPYRERLELQPPGFWTWRDEFHANAGGHFLALFSLYVICELLREKRNNWPWILAFILPLTTVVTSTWSLPLVGLLCGGGLGLALALGRRPDQPRMGLVAGILGIIFIWPLLNGILSAPHAPPILLTRREWHTPWVEFLVQWWPIIILWLSMGMIFQKLPWAARWAFFVVPLMLLGIEVFTIEDGRYNTVEKMWGGVYGVGLVTFFPLVATHLSEDTRSPFAILTKIWFRAWFVFITACYLVSLTGRLETTSRWISWDNGILRLEGNWYLLRDEQIKRLFEIISQLHHATLFTGKPIWAYNTNPALASFTNNRAYVAWTFSEDRFGHKNESLSRAQEMNDFYEGKITDPAPFLRARNISAVVIWPEDAISNQQVEIWKNNLAPYYEYLDCRAGGEKNAGVFLYRNQNFEAK